MTNFTNKFNMQITLEEHLYHMSIEYNTVKEIYSLWLILKKDLEAKMNNANFVFPFYSRHDSSHSHTLITNIELFLGAERIEQLSPTDTFMLLVCAYAHDYGMALSVEEYYLLLKDEDEEFKNFLIKNSEINCSAKILLNVINNAEDNNLEDIFIALISVIPEYIRPSHWEGVRHIESDFKGIFKGRLKNRFIHSIISICQTHGKDSRDILTLSQRANGIISDIFHPRFVAAMIRLGDLLDLDNGRFGNDFESYFGNDNLIPELSKIHYLKHEAISHFFINEDNIEIEAFCEGDNAELVARSLMNWINWLENECTFLNQEWNNIAPRNFGFAPQLSHKKIYVEGNEYQSSLNNLKMELPGDKIFDLLRGCNVYKNKFVAFREILQNAIDATLIQVFQDYTNLKASNIALEEYCLNEKDKYTININIIEDLKDKCVYVEFIDCGIGIDDEDLNYMCQIGAGNISNPARKSIITNMPKWFRPSGVFGIGLQSAFQLTDKIEFYTKKRNRTPRRITFSSYSLNKGYIEVSKCSSSYADMFEKLSNQGTLVRLKIEPNNFQSDSDFDYFDKEFDKDEPEKYLHLLCVEICCQIDKLRVNNKTNYFPVKINPIFNSNGSRKSSSIKCFKPFYYSIKYKNNLCLNIENGQILIDYWNAEKELHLHISIPIYKKKSEAFDTDFKLLEKAFEIKYKFQKIDDFSNLYLTENESPYAQMLESNINLIQCSVNIFDNNVEKYINIDRNILKSDSLRFEDIINTEKLAFTEFCRALCKKKITKKKYTQIISHATFPLIFILLYRFSELPEFDKFLKIYQNEINLLKITISPEHKIELTKLMNEGINVVREIKNYSISSLNDEEINNFIKYNELKNYLPKHYLKPQKMVLAKKNNEIFVSARCFVRREYDADSIVELSYDYLKWQYKTVIDTNYNLLINKALLPDIEFKKLIVHKYPKFFTDPFFNLFDEKFSMHIICPLSNYTIKSFKNSLINRNYDDIKSDFQLELRKDTHFQKCVEYVANNSLFPNASDLNFVDLYFNFIDKLAQLFE